MTTLDHHAGGVMVVDAFCAGPFTGNPAAVVMPDDRPAPGDRVLQAFAAQMNLSETAYPRRDGDAWSLRWFTPTVEVPLCGHATLATAHALWEAGRAAPDERLVFRTLGGELTVTRAGELIAMDFPVRPVAPASVPAELERALGAEVVEAGRCSSGWFAVLVDALAVSTLTPDLDAVAALGPPGVIVTAAGAVADDADVVSRYFAPAVGVPEDPVTGSAHCALAAFWQERLGRDRLHCRQLSARGGELWARCAGDRVELSGRARTVLSGRVDPELLAG